MTETLIIGTRGSALALAQAQLVIEALQKFTPCLKCDTRVIRTSGDHLLNTQLTDIAGKGVFTKEIDEALLRGEINLAVHSLKDLPSQPPEGLVIGAVLNRADPRDVLIARDGLKLAELPPGARIGTDSPRRRAQLLALRPDLQVVGLRGNVETRLRKLDAGQYDAIVLAAAGLMRLGLQSRLSEVLSTDILLPAPGQGALAIQVREGDTHLRAMVAEIDHAPTRTAVRAERAFLQRLGGGCRLPIAAYARWLDGRLALDGLIADPHGKTLFRDHFVGDPKYPETLGEQLAERLLAQGARVLLGAAA
ncbi:hydroxymethylbilane synthase [Candidatus Acetothermia bacterium]|nr:hydroxymethylbilane synthase [Candidatus Acetothermia bacterium]